MLAKAPLMLPTDRWGPWLDDLVRRVNDTYGGTVTLAGGTATVTLPRTEKDANYRIALSCNANETIRWSAKTATTFVLTSSNGASTAAVDYIISRSPNA